MNRGEAYHKQMVETPVGRLIVKLGIPTTIAMLITNVYNLVDTYFVGTLGTSQQGATGILFTLQAILQAFAFMLGHGSGTQVAKNLAEKRVERANTYVSSAFYGGLTIGTILLTFGLIFLEPFMLFLGSSSTILPYAKEYGLWVLIAAPFLITSLVLNNNLRYEGKAIFAMVGIGIGAMLNVFGDYMFIRIMNLGVFGAGMSTAISQFVSFVILLIFYLRKAQTTIRFRFISRELHVYLNIFKAGLPSLLRQGLASISGGILNNVTKPFGDAAIASISVVNRYSNFVTCVGMGIGQGLQPVAAYNYAVKEYGRVRKGTWFTIGFSLAIVSVLAVLTLVFPDTIVRWFNQDPEVIEMGTLALRYAAISLFFSPAFVVASMMFQSIRKSMIASILAALRSGLAFIPTIFLLVYACGLGFHGIALSQPVADFISFLIALPFLLVFSSKLKEMEKEKAENSPQK